MENVPLIDVSFEDDLLIPSFAQGLGTYAPVEAEKMKVSNKLEDVPKLSESPEKKQKRSDRYHLRKSLAWDSAFFTNEGILNSEELAVINSTYNKSGITLPGIQEELRRSSESTTTLDSDSRALEQLEVNLFENVRVSIQKSLSKSNHSRKMVHSDKIKEQKQPDARNSRSQEKIEVSSQAKLKPPNASKRHVLTRQQHEHFSKDRLICMNMPSPKPLIKPTKVSCKASIGMTEIKSNTVKPLDGAAAKQQSIVASNKLTESPGNTRRTTISTKSRMPKNGRNEYSGGIRHPQFVKSSLSVSKVSPSSSIDTVASESSSSTASVSAKFGISLEHSDVRPFIPTLSFSSGLGISKYTGSPSQSCIYDQTKSNINSDSGARLAKPSGLRMPRPTVGFFDKDKSLVLGSNKTPKPALPNNLCRNPGVNLTVGTNRMRPVNLPTVRVRGLTSAPSNKSLKSSETTARIGNHQEPSPKVSKISLEISTRNLKIDFEDKRACVDEVSKELVQTEEQRIHHQSYSTQSQDNSVKNTMNSAGRETGKDIIQPLKIEGQGKMHPIKDQCAESEKLVEMISSLSISDVIDV